MRGRGYRKAVWATFIFLYWFNHYQTNPPNTFNNSLTLACWYKNLQENHRINFPLCFYLQTCPNFPETLCCVVYQATVRLCFIYFQQYLCSSPVWYTQVAGTTRNSWPSVDPTLVDTGWGTVTCAGLIFSLSLEYSMPPS